MRRFVGLSVFIGQLICQIAFAASASLEDYYGAQTIHDYQNGSLKNEALITTLHKTISQGHHSLGYDGARRHLFGQLFLKKGADGWEVRDVYCEKTYTEKEVHLGPDIIPEGTLLNTEHTWPQSRFTNRFPKETQKSDLHHLFPADNKMNSHRGNLRFGEVLEIIEDLKCPIAELGHGIDGDIVFEAPARHKGNVARALFYFALRYQMKINATEEAQLRQWDRQDPIDEQEAARNEEIQKLQGNRNPFIDFPDLLQHIERF